MDDKLWKAWIDFTDEVLNGAEQARKQFEQVAGGPLNHESVLSWFSQWAPNADMSDSTRCARELDEVLEQAETTPPL